MKKQPDSGVRMPVKVRHAASIKRLLSRQELSYRDAALRIGVSAATVSRIANEDGRVIDEAAAKRLAKVLDQPFDNLFVTEMFHVSRDYARRNRVA